MQMRIDKTFSSGKLTPKEFSKKYWHGGKSPYQYHTASIKDGRDEREQLIFNNIRALRGQVVFYRNHGTPRQSERFSKMAHRIKKITVLAVTSTVIGLAGLVLAVCAYLK